jgi:hypothetical protein
MICLFLHTPTSNILSDASHFTYGRISILVGSGNIVDIVLRSTGDKLYYSVVGHFIGEIF